MRTDAVSGTLKALLRRHNKTISELSAGTGIPPTTLYSMQSKTTNVANLDHLKRIAAFFHEDVLVFFEDEDYQRPIELSTKERLLVTEFRQMNAVGKQKVLDYTEDIGGNHKYRGGGKNAQESAAGL